MPAAGSSPHSAAHLQPLLRLQGSGLSYVCLLSPPTAAGSQMPLVSSMHSQVCLPGRLPASSHLAPTTSPSLSHTQTRPLQLLQSPLVLQASREQHIGLHETKSPPGLLECQPHLRPLLPCLHSKLRSPGLCLPSSELLHMLFPLPGTTTLDLFFLPQRNSTGLPPV